MTVGGRNFKFCRVKALQEVINENSSKLENVAMVTSKFGNADFEAPFDQEEVKLSHFRA